MGERLEPPQEHTAATDADPLAHTLPRSSDTDTHAEGESFAPGSIPDLGAGDEPARIGRYRLVQKLGEGGMGVVLLAHDDQLDRPIAIKLLAPEGGGDPKRLLREARSMARLSHPHIAAVHDVGTHQGGVYVAMEYVQGPTLREWMDTPHPWSERRSVLLQAARGLAAAHASGIVHRDFKPDNVIVGADGRVRVLDFGLAKRAPSEGLQSMDATSTAEGHLVGTPRYMAPEQMRTRPVSPASDQFSFCVVAYEVAFGQRPFDGEVFAEVAASVLGGSPEPPPSGTDVPGGLWPVLERGLAVEPERRHPSVVALIEAFEQVEGTAAVPVTRAALADAREAARQQLTVAYAEDQLDADELDDRLERLENATSPAVMAQLVADLVPLAAPPTPGTALAVREPAGGTMAIVPAPRAEIVSIFGESQRGGHWVPARYNRVYTVFGTTELDLREAQLPPGVTEIKVSAGFGSVDVYVLPGTRVVVECSAIFGSAEHDESSVPLEPEGPIIRITGFVIFGSVEVHERLVGEGGWAARKRRKAARKALKAKARQAKALPPER